MAIDPKTVETVQELEDYQDEMSQKEQEFLSNMLEHVEQDKAVSPDQRRWLMDLWGRYVK